MNELQNLLNNVRAVESALITGDIIRDMVKGMRFQILDMQARQMFMGIGGDGKDLRPYYTEDIKPKGYFNSIESAKRYRDWKSGLAYPVNARRNPDAPNLFITGKFHSELEVYFGPDEVMIGGDTDYAKMIVAKYGLERFGLTDDNWAELFATFGVKERLIKMIREML